MSHPGVQPTQRRYKRKSSRNQVKLKYYNVVSTTCISTSPRNSISCYYYYRNIDYVVVKIQPTSSREVEKTIVLMRLPIPGMTMIYQVAHR